MEINNLDDETFDNWGYFVDLENLDSKIPKNDIIVNKIKCSKFQYSDVHYKEYCDEFKFNINLKIVKNENKLNLNCINNNNNKVYIFYITSGIFSLSVTLFLFNYKKLQNYFI
jgi:hypothetical protein